MRPLASLLIVLVAQGWLYAASEDETRSSRPEPDDSAVIEEYRAAIPDAMAQARIPGLSIALVSGKRVIWSEGFGHTDDRQTRPVTDATLFSMQSISKAFTATAVMLAVHDGLLDLDTPVGAYLPGLDVSSRFDDTPLDAITLRHLLSHTAGFTHEAPIGNNFDATFSSFEEHALSIGETWLRFPVGSRYSYSNLGVDLAGLVLQETSGMPFHQYLQEKLLRPLGMLDSSFDMERIRRYEERAIGHSNMLPRIPLEIPMVPSGGLYSSAAEMGRFVQFHLRSGQVGEDALLDAALLETMYTIPPPSAGEGEGYALGIDRRRKHGSFFLNHGGGGFGFLAAMVWYPEYDIGLVMLTNSSSHGLQWDLPHQIMDKVVAERMRLLGIDETAATEPPAPAPVAKASAGPASTARSDEPRWREYEGTYRVRIFGQPSSSVRITLREGQLHYQGQRLEEYRPGLFFTADGEALDMRGEVPTFRNIELERIDISPFVWLLLGVASVIFLSVVLGWPIAGILERLRGSSSKRRWPLASKLTAYLMSVAALLNGGALVFAVPFALYHNYIWHDRFPASVKTLLLMPLVCGVLACLTLLFAVQAYRGGYGSKLERAHYYMVAIAGLGFFALLLHWKQLVLPF